MGSIRAFMIFTNPPYNVRIGPVQGRVKIKHREFTAASGEMSRIQFTMQLLIGNEMLASSRLAGVEERDDGA